MAVLTDFLNRRDTYANWQNNNIVLPDGAMGVITDSPRDELWLLMGDGTTHVKDLKIWKLYQADVSALAQSVSDLQTEVSNLPQGGGTSEYLQILEDGSLAVALPNNQSEALFAPDGIVNVGTMPTPGTMNEAALLSSSLSGYISGLGDGITNAGHPIYMPFGQFPAYKAD